MAWRFLAYRLNGNGTETLISPDVPLVSPEIVLVLSGAGGISGTITPEMRRLQAPDGTPLFVPWSTAIYAEKDGVVRAGAIVDQPVDDSPDLVLRSVSFTSYLDHQKYEGSISRVQVDPLDMFRHLWAHKQGMTRGNLAVTLDATTSPVRIGHKEEQREFTTTNGEEVSFSAGPYTLNWWSTLDMGGEANNLAAETPFDYVETHRWDGQTVKHHIRLGYPTLGRRRADLRFMVGENVRVAPPIEYDGEDYASDVTVLGAGQGRTMIRAREQRKTDRLHRSAVVQDKSITRTDAAKAMARAELAARLGDADISELQVSNHKHAPIGSYELGDEILVRTRPGWSPALELWVRILEIRIYPDTDTAILKVARVEKV